MKKTFYKRDLENNKIFVTREFEGSLDKVWSAWTESKLLDQWWAPKPWKAVTEKQEFKEGGRWFYYMQGPDGSKHWSLLDYRKIDPKKSYEATDAFSDDKGNIFKDFPSTNWKVVFTEIPTGTKVEVEMTFTSRAAMDKLIEMGFEGGFAMGHENLDELLKK